MRNIYVGAKKALVKITLVHAHGTQVPFQYSDWVPTRLTLGEIVDLPEFDDFIAVRESQIHMRISATASIREIFINPSEEIHHQTPQLL